MKQLTLWPLLERGKIIYVPSPIEEAEYRCGHWALDHSYVVGVRSKTKQEILEWLDKDEEKWVSEISGIYG